MIFCKDGQREEDEVITHVVELVVEGLGGSIVEMLTQEHV